MILTGCIGTAVVFVTAYFLITGLVSRVAKRIFDHR